MSAFKGTPGPWEVGAAYGMHGVEVVGDNGNRKVCGVIDVDRDQYDKEGRKVANVPNPEGWANARMIAAAPDSHNANVLFIEAIDCLYNITLAWTDDRIYDELPSSGLALAYFSARSAIAKATGEQS